MRWLVVTAIRYTVVEKPTTADDFLGGSLPVFLERIGDDDRHVRRAAVLTLSTVAHNKPGLIISRLPGESGHEQRVVTLQVLLHRGSAPVGVAQVSFQSSTSRQWCARSSSGLSISAPSSTRLMTAWSCARLRSSAWTW